jgi:hypothetical protein
MNWVLVSSSSTLIVMSIQQLHFVVVNYRVQFCYIHIAIRVDELGIGMGLLFELFFSCQSVTILRQQFKNYARIACMPFKK